MREFTKIKKAISLAIFGSVIAMPAVAFEEQVTSLETSEVERIAVTGSRIARTELSQPTPVIVLDAKDIAKFGSPDLGSILSELPAIGSTDTLIGNNNSNAAAGTSSADLRRLGSARTLVLIDGKRHVAGTPGESTVDLSTIPAALIQRVE